MQTLLKRLFGICGMSIAAAPVYVTPWVDASAAAVCEGQCKQIAVGPPPVMKLCIWVNGVTTCSLLSSGVNCPDATASACSGGGNLYNNCEGDVIVVCPVNVNCKTQPGSLKCVSDHNSSSKCKVTTCPPGTAWVP